LLEDALKTMFEIREVLKSKIIAGV
jgi:hypothetical protein